MFSVVFQFSVYESSSTWFLRIEMYKLIMDGNVEMWSSHKDSFYPGNRV